ncbi:hypothetical protein ACQ7OT_11475, partial [Micrococcus luteus]
MNDLSYRKMSIGNVPNVELFDYMRDIVNNEEDVEGVYYHISHGEIVDPLDLVDEVPDNLLDDDEYFARHPEDEEVDDSNDDGNDDGGDDAESESNSEEVEPMETEAEGIENVEVMETTEVEEPAEVASVIEEVAVEKDVSVQYVRKKKKTVEKPEEIDVIEIAQTVMAEAESIAQIDEVDAGITDPVSANLPTTSPQIDENIGQGLESSPNVVSKIEDEKEKRIAELEDMVAKLIEANELLKASNERKKKRFDEYWDIHNQNLKTFKKLDEDHVKLVDDHVKLKGDYEKLKDEHENLKFDHKELQAECNTLEAEKE